MVQPLLQVEQELLQKEQCEAKAVVLPLVPISGLSTDGTSATDLPVELDEMTYQVCRVSMVADFTVLRAATLPRMMTLPFRV